LRLWRGIQLQLGHVISVNSSMADECHPFADGCCCFPTGGPSLPGINSAPKTIRGHDPGPAWSTTRSMSSLLFWPPRSESRDNKWILNIFG
jgi:hypothetical protein